MLNISFFVGDEQRIKAGYSGRAGTTTMDTDFAHVRQEIVELAHDSKAG